MDRCDGIGRLSVSALRTIGAVAVALRRGSAIQAMRTMRFWMDVRGSLLPI